MNKVVTGIAGAIGVAAVITAVVATNMITGTQASASAAKVSFLPESKTVKPLETFDVTFSLSTSATSADAGFSAAQITLRFDEGNKGIIDLLGETEGGKFQITGTNMTVLKDVVRGTDTSGKFATFTVAVPPETATLQKTATFTLTFKSLAPGSSQISIDTTKSEVSGNTGQSDLTFALEQNKAMTITSNSTEPSGNYSSSATVSPSTVMQGGTVTSTVSVTAGTSITGIIDVEIFDAQNQRVYQKYFADQQMTAGQKVTVSVPWNVGGATKGTYTVKVGIFSNDWKTLYNWNDAAATFTVGDTVTLAPTKAVTAQPTAKPTSKPPATKTPRPTRRPTATKVPSATAVPTATVAPSAVPTTISGSGAFVKGVNLNGSPVTIGGNQWSGREDTSVNAQRYPFDISWMQYSNTAPEELKPMLGKGYWGGSISVSNLTAGRYNVYIYLREDDGNVKITFMLQGNTVASNVESGSKGSWQKLGPYPATVGSDGKLTISTTGGAALISGIEIYKAN